MTSFLPGDWFGASVPLIFGHRGDSSHAPENTMIAFQAALDSGADGVELDVHLSSDGYPVVIHNDTVDATTNGHGNVEALSLADIQSLDAGSHFGAQYAGERIPLLRDVLGTFARDMLVNIELKPSRQHTQALVGAVIEIVNDTHSQHRIWFSSFDPNALIQMQAVRPDLPCGFLYSPLTRWRYMFVNRRRFGALHPHHSLVIGNRVSKAHQQNQRVVVWTVDDAGVACRLRDAGVDVLISNDPARIRREVER